MSQSQVLKDGLMALEMQQMNWKLFMDRELQQNVLRWELWRRQLSQGLDKHIDDPEDSKEI